MKRKIIFAFIILCLITVLGCSGGSECDKGNHSLSEVKIENKEESTCLQEGHYEEVIYCLDCGEEISRNHIDLEKTNHQEDEPVKENVAENTYDIVIYCN